MVMGELAKARSIRPDRENLEIPLDHSCKHDAISRWRPTWEIVPLGCELRYFSVRQQHDAKHPLSFSQNPVNYIFSVRREGLVIAARVTAGQYPKSRAVRLHNRQLCRGLVGCVDGPVST